MNRFKSLLNKFQNIKLTDVKDIPNSELNTKSDLPPQPIIVHSSNWELKQMLSLAATGRFQCYMNTASLLAESELLSSLNIQTNPIAFIKNPLPFWFQENARTLILPFQKKSDKLELLKQFEPFVELTGSRLVQENSQILFQELFMNATLDAPREAKKLGINPNKKGGQFIFAYDHEKFIISCLDPLGALDPLSMVQRIHHILSKDNTSIINFDSKRGGAGIGCSLLFRYSSTLSIVVEEGQGTRVSCTIPLKIGQKKFDLLEKNLQFIKIPSEGGQYEKQRHA